MGDAGSGASQRLTTGARARALILLVIVYTFNFIDRQIVGILAVPIKADLGLTDTQLGLMGGLAFALFYTGLGIPVAMLADGFSRTWIITGALVIWSGMTAVCGLAQNFAQLFLARLGVGVGEAGGVAPAYSLISDYFPPRQRARALSIYSFGVPIGSALGIIFGGLIASHIDWRWAFFAVGLAGIAIAPVFRLGVREPPRGGFDTGAADHAPPRLGFLMRTLASKPSFWLISLGASCSSMMGYGLFFWLPSFFVRSYGLALLDASLYFGAIVLLGGLAGIAVVAVHAGVSFPLHLPATATVFAVLLGVIGLLLLDRWLLRPPAPPASAVVAVDGSTISQPCISRCNAEQNSVQ